MNGLKTTRVLVVDDKIQEAQPFMEALAKRSIGSIYFQGDDENKLPPEGEALTGIRLAALDLDLGIGGEVKPVIDTLINTINRLVHESNGPYLAIAWTTNDDTYFNEFESRQTDLVCRPIGVIKMHKSDYSNIDTIFDKVKASIQEAYPLELLSYWEGLIHKSSGSVMQVLPASSDWKEQSTQTLRLILDYAVISGDRSIPQLAALLSTFNALQLDSIDSHIASMAEEDAKALVSPLHAFQSIDAIDLKAKLNLRLLCTEPEADIVTGNIYRCDDICPQAKPPFPNLDQLLNDMVRSRPPADEEQRNRQLQQEDERIASLKTAGCIAIAMEVTPLCDYQQDNAKLPRFVCGLAVPYEKRRSIKKPQGFMRTDKAPIEFESGDLIGTKILVWNSHYVVSVPRSEVNSEAKLVRLRQSPVIDIQAWLASQLSRPGYLSLAARW